MEGINVSFTPATEDIATQGITATVDMTATENIENAETATAETINTDEAQKTINNFVNYFKSGQFKKDVQNKSKKTGIPAGMIAKGALHKIFGIIADILGIVVSTVCQTVSCVISILEAVLNGAVNGIETLASGLIKVATFNQSGVIA